MRHKPENMASASTGVAQLGANASASQPCASDTVEVRVGTFNVGLIQSMLSQKAKVKNAKALERVATTCCNEGQLDIFPMCEVGGHKQGLAEACITTEEAFPQLTKQGVQSRVTQNYMTSWNFSGSAAQPTAKISLAREPEVFQLSSTVAHPQLVVLVFNIYGGSAWIVLGKFPPLHLVISSNHNRGRRGRGNSGEGK